MVSRYILLELLFIRGESRILEESARPLVEQLGMFIRKSGSMVVDKAHVQNHFQLLWC